MLVDGSILGLEDVLALAEPRVLLWEQPRGN